MEEIKMSNATKVKRSRLSLMLILVVLLVGGSGLAAGVQADPGPRGMTGPRCDSQRGDKHDRVGYALHGLIRSRKDLGLSAEQRTKIKAIALAHKKNRIQTEADIKLAELDFRTGLFSDNVELSTIETALQKSETARTALRLEGVKSLREASAVLTPDQREKWRQTMTARHESGMRGYGHRFLDKPDDRTDRGG
jgi:Spy/CpxP family protein refolding chaperone